MDITIEFSVISYIDQNQLKLILTIFWKKKLLKINIFDNITLKSH